MDKMKAFDFADKMCRKNDKTYIVYHWTDNPGNPGNEDYHILSLDQYYNDPSAAWIPESSVVYSSCEGWY